MNDPHNDEFDWLPDASLSDLYRETSAAEPPDRLPLRILAAARVAAASNPKWTTGRPQQHRAWNWALPLTVAATVALTVGLIRVLPPASEMSEMPLGQEAGKTIRSRTDSVAAPDTLLPDKKAASAVSDQANRAGRTVPASIQPPSPATNALQSAPNAPALEQGVPESPLPAAPNEQDEATTTSIRNQANQRLPAQWLAEIAELRRQGRAAEAEARLAEFRHYYPNDPNALLDTMAEPPR